MDMDVVSPSRRYFDATCRGLTFIELLAATAIAAILMAIAAPSFSEMLQGHRLTAHINQLISHMHYARSLAVNSNKNVIVCVSPDGMTCNKTSPWEAGWILFIDADGDRQRTEAEPILALQEALGRDITITYGAFPYYSKHYILYYPNGRSLANGTFTFCDQRGPSDAKALVLYKSGRIRNGRRMPDGSELSCPAE